MEFTRTRLWTIARLNAEVCDGTLQFAWDAEMSAKAPNVDLAASLRGPLLKPKQP